MDFYNSNESDESLADLLTEDCFLAETSSDESSLGTPRKKRRTDCEGKTTKNLDHHESLTDSDSLTELLNDSNDFLFESSDGSSWSQSKVSGKKNVRKRTRNPDSWSASKRKKAHQAGKEYVSRRGKEVAQKEIQDRKNCLEQCKFNCAKKISMDERNDIFNSFYSLSSATEKRHFIINSTERTSTRRPISDEGKNYEDIVLDEEQASKNCSRRKYSYFYFFHVKGERIRVCKTFYLTTLSISQKPIYSAHNTKNIITNVPNQDLRGRSETSHRQPQGDVEFAKKHINSFPKISSHYCRANSKREYLDPHLNISKMYDLYLEECKRDNIGPVKKSMYNHIFNTDFNLGFHVPKKDRCDFCERFKVAEQVENIPNGLKEDYERHLFLKNEMRAVREEEKKNKAVPVLIFDLQNVILTPQAEISSLLS